MYTITSRANPEIQHIHSLKQAKFRTEAQQFIAEGIRVCDTLIQNGMELIALYVTDALLREAYHIQAIDSHKITLVSESVMEKISTAVTPSGMLGLFRIPPQPSPDQLTAGLVLVNIADSGNMGTLIRSAAAFGVTSVVLVEGVDAWSPKVIQAGAGAHGAVSLFSWTWEEVIAHKKNKQLHALVVSGGAAPQTLIREETLLVVGNEAHGISATQLSDCDHRITLAMPGGTESLNAAIAGSIALYITFVQR